MNNVNAWPYVVGVALKQTGVRFGLVYPVFKSLAEPLIQKLDAEDCLEGFLNLKGVKEQDFLPLQGYPSLTVNLGAGGLHAAILTPGGNPLIASKEVLQQEILEQRTALLNSAKQYPKQTLELAVFTDDAALLAQIQKIT